MVREPQPEWIIKAYNGWNPDTFEEKNFPNSHPDFPKHPGTTYVDEVIPFSVHLNVPDGTPIMVEDEATGEMVVDPNETLSKLPLVHPTKSPLVLGTASLGVSRWLDFNGVAVRERDEFGRSPPFFHAVHGTHNEGLGTPPSDKVGRVQIGAKVPTLGIAAHYVKNAGHGEPGLFGGGQQGDAPFNDIKVDAPDDGVAIADAVTDNAHVMLEFQGARPIRAGSHVPDNFSLTSWVSDLTTLDGYELVRFRVQFDLAADPDSFPFGVESNRPQVDYVRMRMDY